MSVLTLIFLAILMFLLYIGIKKLTLVVLKMFAEVEDQKGILSYGKIVYFSENYDVQLKNVAAMINPFSIFSQNSKLFVFEADSMEVVLKDLEKDNKVEEKKEEKPKSPIVRTIIATSIQYFFHVVSINFQTLKVDIPEKLNIQATNFGVKYYREEGSHLQIEHSSVKVQDITLKEAKYDLYIDEKAFIKLISPSNAIISAICNVENLNFATCDNVMTLSQFTITCDTIPGITKVDVSEVVAVIPKKLPQAKVSLDEVKCDLIYPICNVPHSKIDQLYVSIEKICLASISDDLFYVNDVVVKLDDILTGKPEISINKAELNYSSLDGMELFKIIPMVRGPPPETPDRPVFDFPDFETTVKEMKVGFLFTDKLSLTAQSTNVQYKNKFLQFPIIDVQFNDIEAMKIGDFRIYSKDKTFLDLSIADFHIIKHKEVDFAECIDNAVYGWSLIKENISRGIFDSETLPFPVRLKVDELVADFDDNIVNNSLEHIVKRTKDVLKESVVLKYILKLKMDQCHLTDKQKKMAHERLQELIFHNYKDAVGEIEEKKKVSIQFSNILAEMDSRDFTGMVGMLHKFDPTVKEFYPDVEWETLEGFMLALTISKVKAFAFDLPEPLISVDRMRANGPLVFAEVKCPKTVDVNVTVQEKEFKIQKSVGDMKLYSDFKLSFNTFSIAYGSCLLKIYDDFADAVSGVFPDGVNPSAPLRWWDKMRSLFRGKYDFVFEKLIFNFLGTSDPYNFKDKATSVFDQAELCFTEGVVALKSSCFTTTRCDCGPVIIHFPKFSVTATFVWDTNCNNQRKHIVIPDADKFDDPTYDSYSEFRAKGMDIDFLFDFKPEEFTPFISVDFAHKEWIIEPIMSLFYYPPIEETYKHKYGAPIIKQAPYMSISSLNRIFTYRFNVPIISFRIFDYFPSLETTNINGSSVDVSLINPDLNLRTEMFPGNEDVYDVGLKASSIELNATDLADYAKTTTINSTTIAVIKDLDMCYGKVSQVSVSGIDIYLNQVFSMYLNEFVRSIIHITNKQTTAQRAKEEGSSHSTANASENDQDDSCSDEDSFSSSTSTTSCRKNNNLLEHLVRRKSTQRIATIYKNDSETLTKRSQISIIDKLMNTKFTATIPKIRIIIESMNYEVTTLAVINGTEILYKENTEKKLTAIEAHFNAFSTYFNCDLNTKEDDFPEEVISIDNIKLYQYSKETGKLYNDNHLGISIDTVRSILSTNQIASLKHIYSEIAPEMPKEEKELEFAAEDYFSLKTTIAVSQCMFNFKDQFLVNVAFASIDRTICNIDMKTNGNTEATVTFTEISINDARANAEFNGIVVVKSSASKTNSPHLRIQMRTSPPVGGISVFNHFEMNLDPTIINYDAHFLDVIESMLTAPLIAPMTENASKYIKTDVSIQLPPVLVPDNILPQISDSYTDFLQTFKSSEINVMAKRAEKNFMMRYFKVTNANLHVSYRNEDNTIISEINDFNGELHDIIYQDLTTSIGNIIDKLISTVAKDMIPQFLKHLVGLGKISSTKEFELQKWLNEGNNDQDEVMAKKKQLIFGKK